MRKRLSVTSGIMFLICIITLTSNIRQGLALEPPLTEWNQAYGGDSTEIARSVVWTSDGGYALAGYTDSFGAGLDDFWLVKTDAEGNMQWNRTYGGTGREQAYSLIQTRDGGYALAGITNSSGAGSNDFWLVKTDANGNVQWNQTYGGTGHELARYVVGTSDGGYALAGGIEHTGTGVPDFWLVKIDPDGTMQWNQTYGGRGGDFAYSLVQTDDGGYALVGYTDSFGAGIADFWLVKTDANGNMQWNRTYGGRDYDSPDFLLQTDDGGYVIAGNTCSFGVGSNDFWLVKTDANGNKLWSRTYGGKGVDQARSLIRTCDGGYILAGGTGSFGAGSYDMWLVKADAEGNMIWNQTYGGTSAESAFSLIVTGDGGFALAGNTISFSAGSFDFWLVKLASRAHADFSFSPSIQWVTYPVTFNASASYDPDGSILSYAWDFGDHNHTSTAQPSTTHTYSQPGNYTVVLDVTDSNGLWNSASSHVLVTFQVDVNKDCTVNIIDVTIVATAYNSSPEDPNWNELADLDNNGIVNILDISMVAKDYGKTI